MHTTHSASTLTLLLTLSSHFRPFNATHVKCAIHPAANVWTLGSAIHAPNVALTRMAWPRALWSLISARIVLDAYRLVGIACCLIAMSVISAMINWTRAYPHQVNTYELVCIWMCACAFAGLVRAEERPVRVCLSVLYSCNCQFNAFITTPALYSKAYINVWV